MTDVPELDVILPMPRRMLGSSRHQGAQVGRLLAMSAEASEAVLDALLDAAEAGTPAPDTRRDGSP